MSERTVDIVPPMQTDPFKQLLSKELNSFNYVALRSDRSTVRRRIFLSYLKRSDERYLGPLKSCVLEVPGTDVLAIRM